MMRLNSLYFLLLLFLGCSNSTGLSTSRLIDSYVSGVSYKCAEYQGITNDLGEFTYAQGCGEITFYVGSVILNSIDVNKISDDRKLYISELVGLDRNITSNPKLVQILQFLQSLDENSDPTDGIQISEAKRVALSSREVVNLSDENLTQTELTTLVNSVGDTLVSEEMAVEHFQETLGVEKNSTQESREDEENIPTSTETNTTTQEETQEENNRTLSPIIVPQHTPAVAPNQVWAVVDSNGSGDYTSLYDAVQNKAQKILIKNGTYTDPRTIEIKYADVIIKGESRDGAVIQKSGVGSLLLVVNTHHVSVENLTLDANTYDSDDNEIWEAFGVFNSHNITLKGCKILGANPNDSSSYATNHQDKYAVYFAGPYEDAGQAMIDRYNSGDMDENNTMEDNLIISYIRADATSFSMQRYGKVINNHHIGSVISFFMNRDSNCSNNLIENSVAVGIYVSLPATNNIIDNNTIKNSRASAIRVDKQSDHRDANNNTLPLEPYRSGNNQITNNKIYDTRYMGIEVSHLKDSNISGNYIEHTDFNGVHLNVVDDINVSSNLIVQGGQAKNRTAVNSFAPTPAGIFVDQQTVNALLKSNQIENNDSTGFELGIRVSAWDTISGTKVLDNSIIGNFNQGQISNSRSDTFIDGNLFE